MKPLLFSTVLLASFVLAGCSGEKAIDGTNTDTLKSSWQEMYSEVPESERSDFIEGSGLIILDSLDEFYSSLDRMDTWSSAAYVDLSTDIRHRGDYKDTIRTLITEGFDGKNQTDITSFAENSNDEIVDWLPEKAVENFLQ
ncbi:DUF6694 family lipoprotein [Halomonas sp. AOP35-4E-18]|uniref:DUF6694 family lipoprotein n=1 Tax=Halomonas sp. AOP35-4E-18 TaxID=3457686 RepID=UPI00403373F7